MVNSLFGSIKKRFIFMLNFAPLFKTKSKMSPLFGFDGCPNYLYPKIYDTTLLPSLAKPKPQLFSATNQATHPPSHPTGKVLPSQDR